MPRGGVSGVAGGHSSQRRQKPVGKNQRRLHRHHAAGGGRHGQPDLCHRQRSAGAGLCVHHSRRAALRHAGADAGRRRHRGNAGGLHRRDGLHRTGAVHRPWAGPHRGGPGGRPLPGDADPPLRRRRAAGHLPQRRRRAVGRGDDPQRPAAGGHRLAHRQYAAHRRIPDPVLSAGVAGGLLRSVLRHTGGAAQKAGAASSCFCAGALLWAAVLSGAAPLCRAGRKIPHQPVLHHGLSVGKPVLPGGLADGPCAGGHHLPPGARRQLAHPEREHHGVHLAGDHRPAVRHQPRPL